jgi:hypothetical protein
MKALEFKSKIRNNRIEVPKNIQTELKTSFGKDVRIVTFLDKTNVPDNTNLLQLNTDARSISLTKEEMDSIEKGLDDFKEVRIHSHETARKLYEKYL